MLPIYLFIYSLQQAEGDSGQEMSLQPNRQLC